MPISVAGCLSRESLAKVKDGGYRSVLCFRRGSHLFLVHGFAKNEKENVSQGELQALRRLSKALLALTDEEIKVALQRNEISEVGHAE
jgi:hypothetical protein